MDLMDQYGSLGVPPTPKCCDALKEEFILKKHSANYNEKVHKPQSKSYGRIGANKQLIFKHILQILILLSVHCNFSGSEGLQGTHTNALNPFILKLMTLTLRGGL